MKLFGGKKEKDSGPQVTLQIEGMHCASCGLLIDDELEDIPGVRSASTDVRTGRATVRLDDPGVDPDVLVAAVTRAGDYQARPAD